MKLTDSPDYRTAKEVRQSGLADAVLAPVNANAVDCSLTLAHFLEFVYLPYVREHLKPSTIKGYTDRFKLLQPHLGTIELRKVRPSDIQRILQAVADYKPRVTTTLCHVKAFLSGAFRFAVLKDLVQTNPVQAARVPKGLDSDDGPAYTLPEVQHMLRVLTEPAKTVALVAGLTSLRIGEIEALRWEDVQGTELRICRNIWKGHLGTVKTKASKKPIPLLPIVRKALELHRTRSTGEFIFTGVKGGEKPLILENLLRREMIPLFEKAGIEWLGWHAFRRGVATNLDALGVPDLVISKILRQSSVEVTRRSYIKQASRVSQAAMRKLERAFNAAG